MNLKIKKTRTIFKKKKIITNTAIVLENYLCFVFLLIRKTHEEKKKHGYKPKMGSKAVDTKEEGSERIVCFCFVNKICCCDK